MRLFQKYFISFTIILMVLFAGSNTFAFLGGKFKTMKPKQGNLYISMEKVSDGKAHYFKVKADDGTRVDFFLVQSGDGVIRAAIDSCDVCYRSGKGYVQEGNVMICTNCGRRFATDKINEIKGGCNPAPLKRVIEGKNLVISMKDINANAWYCKFK
ncbi:Fe-S-containing protein [Desulfobacula sp.]